MIRKFFRALFIGALRPQLRDKNRPRFFRSVFLLSMATTFYLQSLAHWAFGEYFQAWNAAEEPSYFGLRSFGSVYLLAFISIVTMMIVFTRSYPGIVAEYKVHPRKNLLYMLFLLYLIVSAILFVGTNIYFVGTDLYGPA